MRQTKGGRKEVQYHYHHFTPGKLRHREITGRIFQLPCTLYSHLWLCRMVAFYTGVNNYTRWRAIENWVLCVFQGAYCRARNWTEISWVPARPLTTKPSFLSICLTNFACFLFRNDPQTDLRFFVIQYCANKHFKGSIFQPLGCVIGWHSLPKTLNAIIREQCCWERTKAWSIQKS